MARTHKNSNHLKKGKRLNTSAHIVLQIKVIVFKPRRESEVQRMSATISNDVLTGKDAKIFVSKVSVNYADPVFKDIIFNSDNTDKFLLIRKKIGSKITIDDVKVVDDDLINSMIESE